MYVYDVFGSLVAADTAPMSSHATQSTHNQLPPPTPIHTKPPTQVGITLLPDGTIVVGSKSGTLMAARADGKGGLVVIDTLKLGDFTRTANAVRFPNKSWYLCYMRVYVSVCVKIFMCPCV